VASGFQCAQNWGNLHEVGAGTRNYENFHVISWHYEG